MIYTDEHDKVKDQNDGTEYAVLGLVDDGGGYDWWVEAIFERTSDGALFYTSDSGCSCNYFGDGGYSLTPIKDVNEGLRLSSDREAMQRSLDARGESMFL